MKKNNFKLKKLLLLAGALTVITTPVVACTDDMTRFPAGLPKGQNNIVLVDFQNVSYSITAKNQFSSDYKNGINSVKQQIEYAMGQQNLYYFFTNKLKYSSENANKTIKELVFNLGLDLLANNYFTALNNQKSSLDDDATQKSTIIFETDTWHRQGTKKIDYAKADSFYKNNNPNNVFDASKIYTTNIKDNDFEQNAINIIDHLDDIKSTSQVDFLDSSNTIWTGPPTNVPSLPTFSNDVELYQKNVNRFKLWLRFRYQQYFMSEIMLNLGESIFTMSNVLNSIFKIEEKSGKPEISFDSNTYSRQLQKLDPNSSWNSKFRYVFDKTVSLDTAENIDNDWNTKFLPSLINPDGSRNPSFFSNLLDSDKSVKNTIDPLFNVSGYFSDTSSREYNKSTTFENADTKADWVNSGDGRFHHWNYKNGTKSSFVYSLPIYWIDVVSNLNFNYKITESELNAKIPGDLSGTWYGSNNNSISDSDFSKFVRNKDHQDIKWKMFWQMLYFLSSKQGTNKDVATTNFTDAAKKLYPQYIKKEQVYEVNFWNAISEYY